MESLFLSSRKSEIKFVEEIGSAKACMLFSNTIALSPKDISWIFTKVSYSQENMSIQQKIKILTSIYDDDPQTVFQLTDIRKKIRGYQQNKNRTPHVISAFNKMIKSVEDLYHQVINDTIELTLLKEVTDFQPFFEQDFVNKIDLPDDEIVIEFDEFHFNHQTDVLLKKYKNKNTPPSIFILPFVAQQFKQPTYSIDNSILTDKTKNWLDASINITGMNELSISELLKIRDDLTDLRERFNQAMNVWIEESDKDSWHFEDLTFYQKEVREIVMELNQFLSQHPILKSYQNKDTQQYLQIGAVSVNDIWHYYHQLNFIDEEGLQKLQLYKNEDAYRGRWPVFFPQLINKQQEQETINSENQKRKFISID